MTDASTRPLFADERTRTTSAVDDARTVARAMALLWTYRPRTAIVQVLSLLASRQSDGRSFSHDDVKRWLDLLKSRKWIETMPHRDGYYRLRETPRREMYRELVQTHSADHLRQALHRLDRYQPGQATYYWPVHDSGTTIAIVRLALMTGVPREDITRMAAQIARLHDWPSILDAAVFQAFDAPLFERIAESVRYDLAFAAATALSTNWRADLLPVCEWAMAQLEGDRGGPMPESLRLALAELLLLRGDRAGVQRALASLESGGADVLRACLLVQEGRFGDAQAAFETALKRRQAEAGARKRVLPASIAWLYPLSLLAQQTPRHLELARKFCLGEAGSRTPHPWTGWGQWVHAISARLGDTALNKQVFAASEHRSSAHADWDALWRLLLGAWLGRDTLGVAPGDREAFANGARTLRERLAACRLDWLVAQVDAALAVLRGDEPPAGFFVPGPRERWRDVLAALQALGSGNNASEAGAATRIVWSVTLGKRGNLQAIEPLEQKRGPRGYGKPKPMSLAKIAGSERLSPWDAKVARAIRNDAYRARSFSIDRAAAMMALVGHPAVVLADRPGQLIDVVEGSPEIEVVKAGDRFALRITPPLRAEAARQRDDDDDWDDDADDDTDDERETAALRALTLIQDTPQRLRVIRFSAAQRRAAQLLSDGFSIPASAQDELQHALHALAGHFEVHADHAQAAREIPTASRLRAELAPVGEALRLRLVVAPLGSDGPRLTPGVGRTRVMASVAGETVGTQRDLVAERAHFEAVQDALPFLGEPESASGGYEWLLDDPENALGAVEALPKLPGVAAVDWPKGKPVRVLTVDARQLGVSVRAERDWFRLEGSARVDESTVIALTTLIEAAQSRSRFMPMGEGVYVALTRSLKARLADLGAVAETDRDRLRIPGVAAAWLDTALEAVEVDGDLGFRGAVERLRRAQDEAPGVPKALQAELRAYQEDGYRWAMRLASAGLGGCLADDMGLGKTLQALAVLVARGGEGPALVVAPTSVCGNWLAEAQRFAPGLKVAIYGEGERDATIADAGPMDVIVTSYTLLQQGHERFAARRWHTVVVDEAQAIKNASAKRAQAAFDLAADFRLALTGTPVENRLAELWSIMRFANPGLLGTLARFTQRFATPIERDRNRDVQQTLRRLMGPFLLRRTKAQVLQELPPRTELAIAVAPGAEEAAHYEALRRQAVADAERALSSEPAGQARMNILAQLTRLRRAACDPRLVNPDLGIVGGKVQAFAELAAELVANGHKTLVFSQFVDFLQLLRAPLDAAGIAYQYLDGSTPAAERTRRVAAFQAGEGDLFLVSLKAGGFGLNLTAADYVLITDPWWNPAAEDQAMGRAHRMGQTRPVTVYRLVTKGTVEERIVELHHDKRALAESILAGADAQSLPSADDLVALIRGAQRAGG